MLYRALWRLRFDSRAWSVQRLAGRLVTTPQTVQSFMDQPDHRCRNSVGIAIGTSAMPYPAMLAPTVYAEERQPPLPRV